MLPILTGREVEDFSGFGAGDLGVGGLGLGENSGNI